MNFPEDMGSATTRTADGNIHYHDIGSGPTLVLVAGFGPVPGTSAWLIFHEVAERLAERFRLILVDLPNAGKSDSKVINEPMHDLYARAVVGVMDALGIEQSILVGSSMGATTSIDVALAHPQRVKGLVLGACHASSGGDPYVLTPFPSHVGRLVMESLEDAPDTPRRIREVLINLVYDTSAVTPELVDTYLEQRRLRPDAPAAWRQSTFVMHSNMADLPTITCPVLVIHGKDDRMVPLEQALMLTSYMRQADLVVLNRCGHWPPFERPDDYAKHVAQFADNVLGHG